MIDVSIIVVSNFHCSALSVNEFSSSTNRIKISIQTGVYIACEQALSGGGSREGIRGERACNDVSAI